MITKTKKIKWEKM